MLPAITRLSVSDEKIGHAICLMQGEGDHSTELCRRVRQEGALNRFRTSASRCVIYSLS